MSLTVAQAAEILDISVDSDKNAVNIAYRVLAKKYHPDAWINATEEEKEKATALFKQAGEARAVLLNPPKEEKSVPESHNNTRNNTPQPVVHVRNNSSSATTRNSSGTASDRFNTNNASTNNRRTGTASNGNSDNHSSSDRSQSSPINSKYDFDFSDIFEVVDDNEPDNAQNEDAPFANWYNNTPNPPNNNHTTSDRNSFDQSDSHIRTSYKAPSSKPHTSAKNPNQRPKYNTAKTFSEDFGVMPDYEEEKQMANIAIDDANRKYKTKKDLFRITTSSIMTVIAIAMFVCAYFNLFPVLSIPFLNPPIHLTVDLAMIIAFLIVFAVKIIYDIFISYYIPKWFKKILPTIRDGIEIIILCIAVMIMFYGNINLSIFPFGIVFGIILIIIGAITAKVRAKKEEKKSLY